MLKDLGALPTGRAENPEHEVEPVQIGFTPKGVNDE